jgi:hypothetical protein
VIRKETNKNVFRVSLRNPAGNRRLVRPKYRGENNIKWILNKYVGRRKRRRRRKGSVWLRVRKSGGMLSIRQWIS